MIQPSMFTTERPAEVGRKLKKEKRKINHLHYMLKITDEAILYFKNASITQNKNIYACV
jgi:hypothetical protein